jgi:hypothetical protein
MRLTCNTLTVVQTGSWPVISCCILLGKYFQLCKFGYYIWHIDSPCIRRIRVVSTTVVRNASRPMLLTLVFLFVVLSDSPMNVTRVPGIMSSQLPFFYVIVFYLGTNSEAFNPNLTIDVFQNLFVVMSVVLLVFELSFVNCCGRYDFNSNAVCIRPYCSIKSLCN